MGTSPLPGHELEERVASVGEELHQRLSAVLDALPGGRQGPQLLARELDLDKVLTSRLLKALRDSNPIAVVHHVPGPEPLRRFIRNAHAREVPESLASAAEAAVDAFELLIREGAGDRSSLGAILSAWLPEAREEFQLRRKQTAFKAMSQLKGAASEVDFSAVLLRPAEDPNFLDVVWIIGILGLQRLRPGSTVKFSVRHATPGAGPHMPTDLDGKPMAGLDDVRLDQFCHAPPAPLVAHPTGNTVRYTLGDAGFGPGSSVDLVFAEVNRGELPRYTDTTPPRSSWVFTEIQTPTKRHQFDVFIADGVFTQRPPRLAIYDTACEGPADPNDPSREMDKLDSTESIQELGRGLERAASEDIPNYLDLLSHVAGRLGWDPEPFRGYRVAIDFPIYGAQICQVFAREHPF